MKSKAQQKNFTQFPNIVLDNIHRLSGTQALIMSVVVRRTFGWHTDEAWLSRSFLCKLTGISHRPIKEAMDGLIEMGWIAKTPDGNSFVYKLIVENIGGDPRRDEPFTDSGGLHSSQVGGSNVAGGAQQEGLESSYTKRKEENKAKETIAKMDSASGQINLLDVASKPGAGTQAIRRKAERKSHPDTELLIEKWRKEYAEIKGTNYLVNWGKDKTGASGLLNSGKSIDEIIDVARRAWKKACDLKASGKDKFTYCNQALSLCGLLSKWNEIEHEVGSSKLDAVNNDDTWLAHCRL